MINSFKGPNRFLSNFYPSIIEYNNIIYPTVEHFFQAGKTTDIVGTYPHALVEGNYWHDNIWGNCECAKCISFAGQNLLGQLLEVLRTHLINGTLPNVPEPVF